MFSPIEEQEFKQQVAEIQFHLPTMGDEDARLAVGMLVAQAFEKNGAMTPEARDLVSEYKRLKPNLAGAMDAFVASRGTTAP